MSDYNSEDPLFIEEESNDDVNLSAQRKILTKSSDAQVDSLFSKYKRGKLNIQPSYQRKFVWDPKKASRLIESILLEIPIPIIYLAQNENGVDNVIDGQQRLTSIFSFLDGKFPDGKKFKLSGLNVFTELNGKTYTELDDIYQEQIIEYAIRVITFTSDSDPDLQYEIFTRLNTGSVALNDQELRNCVYRGHFNDMIKEMADNEDFRSILGLSKPHTRMKDVELVLRFISFYTNSYINYVSPIKKFLNDTMRKNKAIDPIDERKIKDAFKRAVTNTKTLLGDKAFKRYYGGKDGKVDGEWSDKQFNVALYDITMDSMARVETPILMKHLDAIREAYLNLMVENEDFIRSIYVNTSDTPVINTRFTIWKTTLDSIIKDEKADTRCFSFSLKKKLYEQDATCAICGQHIANIDDAAVDHIEQYWMGGKTIPENARLTHRYCNCARSKFDTISQESSAKNEE